MRFVRALSGKNKVVIDMQCKVFRSAWSIAIYACLDLPGRAHVQYDQVLDSRDGQDQL